jgi:hypothetical protein
MMIGTLINNNKWNSSVMRVAYLAGETRHTYMDGPVTCYSVSLRQRYLSFVPCAPSNSFMKFTPYLHLNKFK